MCVDVSCHWLHLHTSLLEGRMSHKFVDLSDHWVIRRYYTDHRVLFIMCAGNEMFYACLYLLHFTVGPLYMIPMLAEVTFPVALAKSVIAFLQGYLAAINLVKVDMMEKTVKRD
jgi:CDP-diacylglycerol--inositol 3-phosphatidyltransferase